MTIWQRQILSNLKRSNWPFYNAEKLRRNCASAR